MERLSKNTKPSSYSKQLVKEKLAVQDNDLQIVDACLILIYY